MNQCILCRQLFSAKVDLLDLFSLKKNRWPRLCPHCQKKFPLLKRTRCQVCSKETSSNKICPDCHRWQKIYSGKVLKNYSLYKYNAAFHDLMVNYKRYGDYELRFVLEELIRDKVKKLNYDYYVPIPTSPEHQNKRQFDTIQAIFKLILPLICLLGKKSGTTAQGQKNRDERLKSPQSFFIANYNGIRDNNSNKRILLLDDIYTTGRTLYNARDKLLEVFPKSQIESFSICR